MRNTVCRMRSRAVCAFFLIVVLVSAGSRAQLGGGGPKIDYKAITETDGAHPGAAFRVVVSFQLEQGWHVNSNKPLDEFSIPTTLKMEDTTGFAVGNVVYPKHKEIKLSFSPEPLAVYESSFAIGLVVNVAADAPLAGVVLKGKLNYQACNDKQCAAPKDLAIEIPVKVVGKDQALTPQAADLFAGIAWTDGAEQTAAPLPVAPLPAAPVAAGSVSDDWRALTSQFRETGRLSGYANKIDFQQFLKQAEMGTPVTRNVLADKQWWLVLALVLSGGLLLNLTPCVLPLIPINIAIIGAGARAGSRARGLALGGAYGLGIALVYGLLGIVVVLGLSTAFGAINASFWFNAAIAVLFFVPGLGHVRGDKHRLFPVSGENRCSQERKGPFFFIAFVMGSVSALLAGACVAPVVIYTIVYAQDQYAKGQVLALTLPFFLGLGMALPWPFAGAGMAFLPKPGAWMVRVKQAFGVFIILFALYYGHLSYRLYSDQYGVDPEAVQKSVLEEPGWASSLESGLKQANAEKKPVLIDFWATWCKNCLTMNATTLKDPAVQDQLKGYVKIKYQAETPTASPVKEVWDHFELMGLPTYIVLVPKGD